MILQIDHHSGVPIYRQVIDQVRCNVMTDGLAAGDQLESVRDLAGRLKVNPMTISKAYSLLEAEGLVERRRGIGVFVADVRITKQKQIKADMLKEVIEKAAVTAVQLGVDQKEAAELFKKIYTKYDRSKGRRK